MKKHMKITALAAAFILAAGLCACARQADHSGKSVVGRVTAIDGTKFTLQLGELQEPDFDKADFGGKPMQGGFGNNGQFDTFDELEGGTDKPDGIMPDDGSTPPEMPNTEMPADGNTPPMPPDDEQREGGKDFMREMFTAGDETLTLDIGSAEIFIAFGGEAVSGTIDDITVGSVLTAEIGADGNAEKVTVRFMGGKGMHGAPGEMPDQPGPGNSAPPDLPDGFEGFDNAQD